MPADLSMNTVLALFYLVFLAQIFVISIYYPSKLRTRILQVVDKHPPEDYPNLYPAPFDYFAKKVQAKRLKSYLAVNYVIAATGIGVLILMAISGYEPALKGGDEIFVMFFFFLQVIPFGYLQGKEYTHFKRMREEYVSNKRSASLTPRRLFDYVSPLSIFFVVGLFVTWLLYFLSAKGWDQPWELEVYAVVFLMTGLNVAYGLLIARFVFGGKLDPYKAGKDQEHQGKVMAKVYVLASIGGSLFLILTQVADEYALEVFDPVMTSIYMQLCMIFGTGLVVKSVPVDDIDFEVYREKGPEPDVL